MAIPKILQIKKTSIRCFNSIRIFYYIDTGEIPGFYFLEKVIFSPRAVKIRFFSFTCEDIGVAMVTNMISQLQESFPLRRVVFYVEISYIFHLLSFSTAG